MEISPHVREAAFDPRARLPGFGPGTQVMTDLGEIPVEWLASGDRVLTRDHGPQPVLWIGHARITRDEMLQAPALAPHEIAAGALGWGRPGDAALFAPRTRLLLAGWEVALHFGEDEALARISDMTDGAVVPCRTRAEDTRFTWLLLPMHELVQVNGIWAETILLDTASRAALAGRLPEGLGDRAEVAAGHAQAARLCLQGREVAALRGRTGPGPDIIDRVA